MRKPERQFWRGRRVCVTGGAGFLGYHLVRQLLSLEVVVHVHTLASAATHPLRSLPVKLHEGDIRDSLSVRQAVTGSSVVFHTAGVVGVAGRVIPLMHEVHEQGTRNVLAALQPGARLVHTSSIVAVGALPGKRRVTEDDPFTLDTLALPYVQAKRAAEKIVLDAVTTGTDAVVVNPSYLVGPEDHAGSVMGAMCVRFWRGRLPLAPPGGFNLVDVRDVAVGHLLAAEHGQTGRRYILGGENHTAAGLLRLLAQAAGMRPRALLRIGRLGMTLFALLAEARAYILRKEAYPSLGHVRLNRFHWYCDSSRARRELGYEPRPVCDSLCDAYDWHSRHSNLRMRSLARWWMRPAA